MSYGVELSEPLQNRVIEEARRHNVQPEWLIERIVEHGLHDLPALLPPLAGGGDDPTLALFAAWDAEDATDDPKEIVRRQRDGDGLLAALEQTPLSLRRVQLPDDKAVDEAA